MWPWAAQNLVSCLQFIQLYHLPVLPLPQLQEGTSPSSASALPSIK